MPNGVTLQRRLLFIVCAIGSVACVNAGVVDAESNDTPPEFHRSPDAAFPGDTIAVSGRGCTLDGRPAQFADVYLSRYSGRDSQPVYGTSEEYPVAANGDWADRFVIPVDAPPGPYRMSAACRTSDMIWNSVDTEFTVYDPNAPPTTASAPATTTKKRGPTVVPTTLTSVPPTTIATTASTRDDPTATTVQRQALNGREDDSNVGVWIPGLVGIAAIAGAALVVGRARLRAR